MIDPDRFPVTAYFLSGTRYKLTMGCDGLLWLVLTLPTCLFAWAWRNIPGMIVAGIAYGIGITVLRKIGRYDPLAVKVFFIGLQYKLRYLARSGVRSKPGRIPMRWIS